MNLQINTASIFALMTLLFSGCAGMQATGDRYNVDYVKSGMEKTDVLEYMRDPADSFKVNGQEIMVWNGACITLVDNKVTRKTEMSLPESDHLREALHSAPDQCNQLLDATFHTSNVMTSRAPASLGFSE